MKANLRSESLVDLILDTQKLALPNSPLLGSLISASSQSSGSGASSWLVASTPAPEPIPGHTIRARSKPLSRSAPIRRSGRSASRARDHSGARVIVHDETPRTDVPQLEVIEPMDVDDAVNEEQPAARPPDSRTRKAQDTQSRLELGRPAVAGDQGARTVTKPASASKGRWGKDVRIPPQVEPPIAEGVYASTPMHCVLTNDPQSLYSKSMA